MPLQLYKTLTRSVVPFEPLFPENRDPAGKQTVGMYCCGPTVYDYGHIGNFRTFVFADLVRRYLEFRGYAVRHVMNITDVEDKIIRKVSDRNSAIAHNPASTTTFPLGDEVVTLLPGQFLSLERFTSVFSNAFMRDLDLLACQRPHDLPKATDYIPQIVALIEKLVARGMAYKTPDGSVYFSIEKYRGCGCKYGQLVNLNFDAMRVGERVASDEYDKESVADFALWKARVPEDGDVFWETQLGEGRPGWHIECSAMSMALLGPSFDLHLGGEDLAFPHHEDEIAQSEGAGVQNSGQPFVKHWMHGSHLLVEGKKMSKSLGNYFTVRDLTTKGYTGREIRFLLLSAHYRETFNFTLAGLDGARTALARLDECIGKLQEIAKGRHTIEDSVVMESFTSAMDDDLNVARAWAVIFDWVRSLNRSIASNTLTVGDAEVALATWHRIRAVFEIPAGQTDLAAIAGGTRCIPDTNPPIPVLNGSNEPIPEEVYQLVFQRYAAKKAKDFARADAIRGELKTLGWIVEDTAKGPKLKRL